MMSKRVEEEHLQIQEARAGGDGPRCDDALIFHDMCAFVQRDGGADVPRDSVERRSDGELVGVHSFDDEMLFAVGDRGGVVELREYHAWMRHFAGDGFVAKVEAEAVFIGSADDAREDERGGNEKLRGASFRVTRIPKNARAGAALDIAAVRVEVKRG